MFFANSKAENQKSKTKKLKNQDFVIRVYVCVRKQKMVKADTFRVGVTA